MNHIPQEYSTVIAYTHVATDDLQFRLVQSDIWVREANIHCISKDALYGKVNHQPATIVAGDIVPFQDFNLADIWFRNAGGGNNTTIYIVGITMSKVQMKKMELI